MKGLIILVSTFFFVNICKSQPNYLPLVKENSYCLYFTYFYSEPYPKPSGAILTYFIRDSIYNDKIYGKRFSSSLSGHQPCPPELRPCFYVDEPFNPIDTSFTGLYRDDIFERKVFYIPPGNNEEIELYNFALLKGDTISEYLINILPEEYSGKGIIDSISYDIIKGENRKVLYLEAKELYFPFETFFIRIIEGIGHSCNHCEGTLSDCNIVSKSDDSSNPILIQLKIYPNPTCDNLTVLSDADLKMLYILNQKGRVVMKSDQEVIPVNGLPPGLYILQYITTENVHYFKKFLKL